MSQTIPASGDQTGQNTPPSAADIQSLIGALASRDVLARDRARYTLVQIGQRAVVPLIAALDDADGIVRWEAAQALGQIRDPAAAPALIAALNDQRFDVRWLAARGLIALGRDGIAPLLRSLEQGAWDDVWLREGAHHILRAQIGGPLGLIIAPVVAALEGMEPSITVPIAAYNALSALHPL
jgi:HEAT repeat protein